jgi:hypothetical protein
MKITLTETGFLALVSLLVGFIISFCKQAEQSRCKDISICWGALSCNREPLSADAILEMREESEEKKESSIT